MSSITVVLGIDKKTIEQARISIPTWKLYRPQLWDVDWLIFYDTSMEYGVTAKAIDQLASDMCLPSLKTVVWNDICYETQREKMLTGFVHVPAQHVTTDWWMKIDTDALAKPFPRWISSRWFEPQEGELPEYIASGWGYTKAKGGGSIEDWADRLEAWGDEKLNCPRLELHKHINGKRICMPRMASWVSYYNTQASRRLADLCDPVLPVPSQDTMVWYYAARRKVPVVHVKQKNFGWSTISNIKRLRAAAQEILDA